MYGVFVPQTHSFTVGDPIEVVVLMDDDGHSSDPSKCLYLPHQEATLRAYSKNLLCSAVYVSLCVLLLRYGLGGMFVWSVSQLQETVGCSGGETGVSIAYYGALLGPVVFFVGMYCMTQCVRKRAVEAVKSKRGRAHAQALLEEKQETIEMSTKDGSGHQGTIV